MNASSSHFESTPQAGIRLEMKRIALTGGIACGKSLVAAYLNELGVETLDADDIVHEVLPSEERQRLAKIVFANPSARKELESQIHPLVRARFEAWFASPPKYETAIRVAVIPLLYETGWAKEYDFVCCVASEPETQIARMMAKRGYSREEAEARMRAQMPIAEKAALADYTLYNNGSADDLHHEVERLVARLKTL